MLSPNFIILVAVLTVSKLTLANNEIQLADGIDEVESESTENKNSYAQHSESLEKILQTEKTASHSTEINVKESDESLKVDIVYGASSQNEKKYFILSNEERATNDHESKKPDKMERSISDAYGSADDNGSVAIESIEIIKPEIIFPNERQIMGSKSSEDKSGQTDTGSIYQLNGIIGKTRSTLSASSRAGNNARSLTLDSYEYSTQIGNKIYPIDKAPSLQQHIQSLYATKLFNPAAYTAATQQNSGGHYIPSDTYRTLNSTPREKLSFDNVSDNVDQNAYPYSPPTYNQVHPNNFRIGNPFNTHHRENAPNYYLLDQSQLKQPLSTLYQERLRRNVNVAPVTNPLFRYYPTLIN